MVGGLFCTYGGHHSFFTGVDRGVLGFFNTICSFRGGEVGHVGVVTMFNVGVVWAIGGQFTLDFVPDHRLTGGRYQGGAILVPYIDTSGVTM